MPSEYIHLQIVSLCVEIYMDDFFVYGDSFYEAFENLEKILIKLCCNMISFDNLNFLI